MARLNAFQRFEDLKTQTKLLTTFGVISVIIVIISSLGVWATTRLSQHSDTIYLNYTVPLIDFNTMLFNINKYHGTLQDLARAPSAADFKVDVAKIEPYRQQVEQLIAKYEARTLRVSSSGRDEALELVGLKGALVKFFQQADAGVAALAEGFQSKALSTGQAQQMRELGQLTLTVGIAPALNGLISRHAEQIKTLQEIAKDLSNESKSLAGM